MRLLDSSRRPKGHLTMARIPKALIPPPYVNKEWHTFSDLCGAVMIHMERAEQLGLSSKPKAKLALEKAQRQLNAALVAFETLP